MATVPTVTALTSRVVLGGGWCLVMVATAYVNADVQIPDKHELFERLKFSEQLPYQTAVIEGRERTFHRESRTPDPDPDKAVARFSEKLKAQAQTGELPLTDRQKSQ